MLHVATAHLASTRWIEIQTRHLREHLHVPYTTWATLALIDGSFAARFDRAIDSKGPHAGKLNHLAVEISQVAADEDLLMFLDGDAFPIADPLPTIEDALSRAPLLAVCKAEDAEQPRPSPCFCVTRVGTWRGLAGDWSDGYAWRDGGGRAVTDVGANLLRRLQLTGTAWTQLPRTNPRRLDPAFFAIYGDVVYHHGVGGGELTRAHRALAPAPLPVPRVPLLAPLTRRLDGERRRAWERATRRRYVAHSERILAGLQAGGSGWLAEVS
jgi:hypothetical protein